MSQDQNARWSHNLNFDNESIEKVEQFKYLGTTIMNQFYSVRNYEQNEVRLCLLSFGAQSFVFQFVIYK